MAATTSRDKLIDAQVAVLGAMLIDGRTVGPVLQAIRAEYFFTAQYRTIFEAIAELYRGGKAIDPVIVAGALGKDYQQLLAEIIQATPTAANVKFYAEELRKRARMRLLQDAAEEMQEAEDEDQIRGILDRINGVMVNRPGVKCVTMGQALQDFYKRHDDAIKPAYLPWRFAKLNELWRTQAGDLCIIGGYPSDGKTTFALATAYEQAKSKRVGFFSFETSAAKLTDALVCACAQIGLPKIQLNALNAADWDTMAHIAPGISERKLELIEAAGMTVSDIRTYSMARHYDVIYIDYLQLIEASSRSEWAQEDFRRVTKNSRDLKLFGLQQGVTVVALSQMTRPQRSKDGRIPPPGMSNLRSSGQVEQDADFILLLFRESQTEPNSKRIATIGKNKTGVPGLSFYLDFDGEHQTFRESWKDYRPRRAIPEDMDFRPCSDEVPEQFRMPENI